MSATAPARPSSEISPLLTEKHIIWGAAMKAQWRIFRGQDAGTHSRWRATKAVARVWEISNAVDAGTLDPAQAALELLRVELRLAQAADRKRRNG
ncbi:MULTISPECIES: hypothetical protein [Methylobacterium]|nr:hypothetical protein [Methylobacterium aquaticum]QRE77191.1 hypothetical protein F1D61_29895 [Methylobacterium aquaticum]